VDVALLMVAALENDDLIHDAPVIVGCLRRSALAHVAGEYTFPAVSIVGICKAFQQRRMRQETIRIRRPWTAIYDARCQAKVPCKLLIIKESSEAGQRELLLGFQGSRLTFGKT
jgi:hypothetical protein